MGGCCWVWDGDEGFEFVGEVEWFEDEFWDDDCCGYCEWLKCVCCGFVFDWNFEVYWVCWDEFECEDVVIDEYFDELWYEFDEYVDCECLWEVEFDGVGYLGLLEFCFDVGDEFFVFVEEELK